MQYDRSQSRGDAPKPADAEDPRFDELLRGAMHARPEPTPPLDLASRAMKMARVEDRTGVAHRTRQLARQRWWAQISGLAAAVLIVAMLAGAAHRMWSRGDIAALTASDSSDTTTTTSDIDSTTVTTTSTTTSGTTNTIAIVFVAELLVLAVVLMSISRTGPTTPFGAEALAGFW